LNSVRITTLVDNNSAGDGMLSEHGLSFFIQSGSASVLFDTGQGRAIGPNARKLGLDPASADAVVLSHGHYDHTGGLEEVLSAGTRPALHAHPAAFEPKFARDPGGKSRVIGMPAAVKTLAQLSDINYTTWPVEVCASVRLTGPIPRETEFEDTGGPFFLDAECACPDRLVDDQAVFIETDRGTVVVLGCAHSGLINTLQYVRRLTSDRPILAVIGGMHLGSASKARLDRTVDELREIGVGQIGPCHCTGDAAAARFREEFPEGSIECRAGTVIEY
jgi:7,8-dihydropterin-6-yl-methyl-4-(beta-D-ribofuranosyl)aminobenzene 5'-phosphate synthase